MKRKWAPELHHHPHVPVRHDLVDIDAAPADPDREGRGLAGGLNQRQEDIVAQSPDVEAVEIGQPQVHRAGAEPVAVSLPVEVDEILRAAGGQHPVHDRLGHAELLGDLGDAEGRGVGLAE